METVKSIYRQLRARSRHYTASDAIAAARRRIAGPLAEYAAKRAAWEAEPDKRRYAPGGYANRPKYPELYLTGTREPSPVDGLRDCDFVDTIFPRRFDHKGWFADSWQDSVYRAQVWQLPARNGQVQYIAGYVEPESDYLVLVTLGNGQPEIFSGDNPGNSWDDCEALDDAARAADHLAEKNAETAREYDEKWQDASQASDERDTARDELKQARADARLAIAALRQQRALGVAPMVCDMLRAKVQECRKEMRESLETIAKKTNAIASLDMQGEF